MLTMSAYPANIGVLCKRPRKCCSARSGVLFSHIANPALQYAESLKASFVGGAGAAAVATDTFADRPAPLFTTVAMVVGFEFDVMFSSRPLAWINSAHFRGHPDEHCAFAHHCLPHTRPHMAANYRL